VVQRQDCGPHGDNVLKMMYMLVMACGTSWCSLLRLLLLQNVFLV